MGVAHCRVTLKGTLSSGADIWSCGFSTPPVIGGSSADMEDLALTASSIFVLHGWVGIKAACSNTVAFTAAQAQLINDTGHVIAAGESVLDTPSPGTSSSHQLPPQVSTVVSLITETAGPRGRGRMYLPPFAVEDVSMVGALDSSGRTSIANSMQDFFNQWNSDPGTLSASVASNVGGFVSAITKVKVGSVFDTQRRRRDAIAESYATALITI